MLTHLFSQKMVIKMIIEKRREELQFQHLLHQFVFGTKSSAIRIEICEIAAETKSYNSITKKKKQKHEIIVLLRKYKLKTIEVLISIALVD